ncbi:hypothetical protein HOLleu_43329 [Holothuria leucospilota]|uniref:Uncharacterized protein n=1 Tax=Holothuria leucospilota TaxID=206669 RepID=A0A9Q0YBP3_HOLLE|nr:hypothetical protein HOLleu_43328 [Holothuria leucospilota]KAJ8018595.1 hypothetical protein HOLleu_43329 [Holothuria leucospilota]
MGREQFYLLEFLRQSWTKLLGRFVIMFLNLRSQVYMKPPLPLPKLRRENDCMP